MLPDNVTHLTPTAIVDNRMSWTEAVEVMAKVVNCQRSGTVSDVKSEIVEEAFNILLNGV